MARASEQRLGTARFGVERAGTVEGHDLFLLEQGDALALARHRGLRQLVAELDAVGVLREQRQAAPSGRSTASCDSSKRGVTLSSVRAKSFQ